mmetsp:Transcript_474/g.1263  ORF Transcript_474/g.1263 Transcript_474/m.1263 type:complete len:270 (-) Transcript_474:3121-3930(-)
MASVQLLLGCAAVCACTASSCLSRRRVFLRASCTIWRSCLRAALHTGCSSGRPASMATSSVCADSSCCCRSTGTCCDDDDACASGPAPPAPGAAPATALLAAPTATPVPSCASASMLERMALCSRVHCLASGCSRISRPARQILSAAPMGASAVSPSDRKCTQPRPLAASRSSLSSASMSSSPGHMYSSYSRCADSTGERGSALAPVTVLPAAPLASILPALPATAAACAACREELLPSASQPLAELCTAPEPPPVCNSSCLQTRPSGP